MSYDYIFKVLVIGSLGTGKSCVVERFTRNKFNCVHNSTVGVDFSSMLTTINNNERIKLHIWDTAGNRAFGPIINSYYRGVAGAIIVFDITKRHTFEAINDWYGQIQEHSDNVNMPILLLGNKCDNESRRGVSREEAELVAKTLNMIYYETSAKKDINIHECFHALIKNIYQNMDKEQLGPGISPHFSQEKQKLIKKNSKSHTTTCCCIIS